MQPLNYMDIGKARLSDLKRLPRAAVLKWLRGQSPWAQATLLVALSR